MTAFPVKRFASELMRMRASWPGWGGLLVGVVAYVYLSAALAWPPLTRCWENGFLVGTLCLIVYTAPVWGSVGGMLALVGWLRAGGNLMIIASSLTLVAWLWMAPVLALLVWIAYLVTGIKAHFLYRGIGVGADESAPTVQ